MTHARPTTPLPRRRTRGFTLVELLTSIGIIMFVLSLAVLALGPALRTASTKDAARRFRSALDAARVEAIQKRRAVRFEAFRSLDPIETKKQSVAVYAVPEQWQATPSAGGTQVEYFALPDSVAVRTTAGGKSLSAPLTSISISFTSEATVKSVFVDGSPISEDPVTSQFLLRFHTLREATADERKLGACFIEITPLTGVIRSYGSDEANAADLSDLTSP